MKACFSAATSHTSRSEFSPATAACVPCAGGTARRLMGGGGRSRAAGDERGARGRGAARRLVHGKDLDCRLRLEGGLQGPGLLPRRPRRLLAVHADQARLRGGAAAAGRVRAAA